MLKLTGKKKVLFDQAVSAVESEIAYACSWDEFRDANETENKKDEQKSFEDWISWAELELRFAREKGYYDLEKKAGRDHVRKAVGHLMRCLSYFPVDGRNENDKQKLKERIEKQ